MISAVRGLVELVANHFDFVVMFVLVVIAARFVTKASVRGISFGTIIFATGMIWWTEFPFWKSGQALTPMQLAIGSLAGWVAISLLSIAIDRYAPAKRLP
ncbi:MAG: hypothetical protein AAF941_06385 [Pseudomonadota bacterium]